MGDGIHLPAGGSPPALPAQRSNGYGAGHDPRQIQNQQRRADHQRDARGGAGSLRFRGSVLGRGNLIFHGGGGFRGLRFGRLRGGCGLGLCLFRGRLSLVAIGNRWKDRQHIGVALVQNHLLLFHRFRLPQTNSLGLLSRIIWYFLFGLTLRLLPDIRLRHRRFCLRYGLRHGFRRWLAVS